LYGETQTLLPCIHLCSLREVTAKYQAEILVIILKQIAYLICLLTSVGLSLVGSTHLHTNNTQNNKNNN